MYIAVEIFNSYTQTVYDSSQISQPFCHSILVILWTSLHIFFSPFPLTKTLLRKKISPSTLLYKAFSKSVAKCNSVLKKNQSALSFLIFLQNIFFVQCLFYVNLVQTNFIVYHMYNSFISFITMFIRHTFYFKFLLFVILQKQCLHSFYFLVNLVIQTNFIFSHVFIPFLSQCSSVTRAISQVSLLSINTKKFLYS